MPKPSTTQEEPRDAGPNPLRLSPRQREVLTLVAQGATDNEIACQLCLSSTSVSQYMVRIRTRLGACSRAHAVAIALRHGILEVNPSLQEGT